MLSVLTYLDEVRFVAEGELEGAVALGEAEGAGLVVALQVVLHRLALVTLDQQQDQPGTWPATTLIDNQMTLSLIRGHSKCKGDLILFMFYLPMKTL